VQKPHVRADRWYYYPYSGRKRLSPKPLGLPSTVPVERATAAMIARGDHQPAARAPVAPVKTLLDHVDDYEAYRRARRPNSLSPFNARRIRRVIRGCGFTSVDDVTEERVTRFVSSLRGPKDKGGLSWQTAVHFCNQLRGFFAWLVKNRRATINPLASLESPTFDGDLRSKRRAFTQQEREAIYAAAKASTKTIQGLSGYDRYMMYRVAAYVGVRAGVIALLTPEHFSLDSTPPVLVIDGRDQKNGEALIQPLASDIVPELREYLAALPKGKSIWKRRWELRQFDMVRADCAAAGVAPETPEGKALFHSFRHTFTTAVRRTAGANKLGRSLTGHKDSAVFDRYDHPDLAERTAVIEQLYKRPAEQPAPPAPTAPATPLDWLALNDEFHKVRKRGELVIIGDLGRDAKTGEWILFSDPLIFGKQHWLDEASEAADPYTFNHSSDDGPTDVRSEKVQPPQADTANLASSAQTTGGSLNPRVRHVR
jgi:integrase